MKTKATLRLVGEQTYKSGVQADWDRVGSSLNDHGNAVLEKLLTQTDCERLAACYGDDEGFRSR
ncbi:MAG: proline hydroxylase, partial [Xanthobacteraceae bacterium]